MSLHQLMQKSKEVLRELGYKPEEHRFWLEEAPSGQMKETEHQNNDYKRL